MGFCSIYFDRNFVYEGADSYSALSLFACTVAYVCIKFTADVGGENAFQNCFCNIFPEAILYECRFVVIVIFTGGKSYADFGGSVDCISCIIGAVNSCIV